MWRPAEADRGHCGRNCTIRTGRVLAISTVRSVEAESTRITSEGPASPACCASARFSRTEESTDRMWTSSFRAMTMALRSTEKRSPSRCPHRRRLQKAFDGVHKGLLAPLEGEALHDTATRGPAELRVEGALRGLRRRDIVPVGHDEPGVPDHLGEGVAIGDDRHALAGHRLGEGDPEGLVRGG